MFEIYIDGSYRGSFNSAAEAFAEIEKSARPYRSPWKILDPYREVLAQD